MAKTIFPEEMLKSSSSGSSFTLESIAGKLTYFHLQIHFIHWRTTNKAEHEALGSLYEYVQDFKDDFIEKYMGYEGRRIKNLKVDPINPEANHNDVVKALEIYAHEVYEFMEDQEYCDLENMAQELSGKAAKTLYLLTLS